MNNVASEGSISNPSSPHPFQSHHPLLFTQSHFIGFEQLQREMPQNSSRSMHQASVQFSSVSPVPCQLLPPTDNSFHGPPLEKRSFTLSPTHQPSGLATPICHSHTLLRERGAKQDIHCAALRFSHDDSIQDAL